LGGAWRSRSCGTNGRRFLHILRNGFLHVGPRGGDTRIPTSMRRKNISNKAYQDKRRTVLGNLRRAWNVGTRALSCCRQQFEMLALRLLGIERRRFGHLGLLGGGLAASSGFRTGSFGAGTLRRSRGTFSGCSLLFFLRVLRILLRRVTADRDSKYVAQILLRQSIELRGGLEEQVKTH
jgi:hypothetical protein